MVLILIILAIPSLTNQGKFGIKTIYDEVCHHLFVYRWFSLVSSPNPRNAIAGFIVVLIMEWSNCHLSLLALTNLGNHCYRKYR